MKDKLMQYARIPGGMTQLKLFAQFIRVLSMWESAAMNGAPIPTITDVLTGRGQSFRERAWPRKLGSIGLMTVFGAHLFLGWPERQALAEYQDILAEQDRLNAAMAAARARRDAAEADGRVHQAA